MSISYSHRLIMINTCSSLLGTRGLRDPRLKRIETGNLVDVVDIDLVAF